MSAGTKDAGTVKLGGSCRLPTKDTGIVKVGGSCRLPRVMTSLETQCTDSKFLLCKLEKQELPRSQ